MEARRTIVGWGGLVHILTQNGEEALLLSWNHEAKQGDPCPMGQGPHSSMSRNLGLKRDWFSGSVKLEHMRLHKHLYT